MANEDDPDEAIRRKAKRTLAAQQTASAVEDSPRKPTACFRHMQCAMQEIGIHSKISI